MNSIKNDFKESTIKHLEETTNKLKDVRQELVVYGNYEKTLERQIIEACELADIHDKINGVEVVETTIQQPITMKKILDLFNGDDKAWALENIVVTVRMAETENNLYYNTNLQDVIKKGVITQLETLSTVKVKKVV